MHGVQYNIYKTNEIRCGDMKSLVNNRHGIIYMIIDSYLKCYVCVIYVTHISLCIVNAIILKQKIGFFIHRLSGSEGIISDLNILFAFLFDNHN